MARKAQKRRKATTPQQTAPLSRRALIQRMALYGVGLAALGGGGTAFAMDLRKKLAEGDLSRIGNGLPSVVQIHDPQCSQCSALQKAARRAFRLCDEDTTQYLVANVRNLDGAAFQSRMGLPHVTLVFFDGAGRHVHTLQGVTPAAEIKAQMETYLS